MCNGKENIINQLQIDDQLWILLGFPPYKYIIIKTYGERKNKLC